MSFIRQRQNLLICFSLCCFVVVINFITMPKHNYPGDPMATRSATTTLLRTGNWDVPVAVVLHLSQEKGQYYFQNTTNKKLYSKYGILNTVLYIPPILIEKWYRGELDYDAESRIRTLLLNIFNIIISIVITVYLFFLLSLYTKSSCIKVIFILAAFYSTFLWNYLRAPTFEIFHVLFFLMFYYHLIKYKRQSDTDNDSFHLLASVLSLVLLCLCKLVFMLLIPLLCSALLLIGYQPAESIFQHTIKQLRSHHKTYVLYLILPIAGMLAIILLTNHYKFGSPFETGYSQWAANENLFGGDLRIGIIGFLFSSQRSIFLHFPVLLVALLGIKTFYTKHAFDTLFAAATFILFLLTYSKFIHWAGEACYGPRYLLFILPVLSLPLVEVLHHLFSSIKKRKKQLLLVFLTGMTLYSILLQVHVNSLRFHTYYKLEHIMNKASYFRYEDLKKYMQILHFGQIYHDLIHYEKFGDTFYPLETFRGRFDKNNFAKMEKDLQNMIQYNYWLF
ncbi:MAG: hypothetical protein HQM14_07480 [SAR324 cluster bacterium]|nr:hypothetical protein [SAR324 cluster bacterium]